jgi:hypothetical protein
MVRTSGISDSWFDSCLAVDSTVFSSIFSAFQLLFHFDSLNFILVELLLLLPVFFRLYGFGVQQKLTKFYDETRSQLIRFMYLFGLSTVLCSTLQLLLRQSPACISWDGVNYLPLHTKYASPNLDIAVIAILMCILISVTLGIGSLASIVAFLFFAGVFVAAILSGTATVNQALLSSSLGAWLFFTFRFLPPIFVPACAALVSVPSLAYAIVFIVEEGKESEIVAASVVPAIRGCLLLIVNIALYLRFVRVQEDFQWTRVVWDRGDVSSSGSGAVIPDVVTGTGDSFGKKLTRDIFDSGIAFIAVLACNQFVAQYFNYELYNVPS